MHPGIAIVRAKSRNSLYRISGSSGKTREILFRITFAILYGSKLPLYAFCFLSTESRKNLVVLCLH